VIGIACYGGYRAIHYIGPLAPLFSSQLHFSLSCRRRYAANAAGYHAGMLMFTGIALLSVLCAVALWRSETGPHVHGLETITTNKMKTP